MPETEVLESPAVVEETSQPAATPEVPEATASPSAPVEETGITEPAAATSTRPRGPDGRFIKADGTQATVAEQAVMEAAEIAPPPAPTPAPAAVLPFVVRGAGQKHEMPGSSLDANGALTVAPEHVPMYRQLIAEGIEHRTNWRRERQEYERRIQEAEATKGAGEQKYHNAALRLWAHIEDPNWLAAAVADPREIQFLARELGLELREAGQAAPKQPEAQPVDETQQHQQLVQAATATLHDYLDELLESPQARAVYADEKDRAALKERYGRRLAAYFVDREGESQLSLDAVDADFNEEMALRQEAKRVAVKAAQDAKKAEEFNAKRNQPTVVAPPVVSTKGPGSNGTGGSKTYQTRDEWRRAQGMI